VGRYTGPGVSIRRFPDYFAYPESANILKIPFIQNRFHCLRPNFGRNCSTPDHLVALPYVFQSSRLVPDLDRFHVCFICCCFCTSQINSYLPQFCCGREMRYSCNGVFRTRWSGRRLDLDKSARRGRYGPLFTGMNVEEVGGSLASAERVRIVLFGAFLFCEEGIPVRWCFGMFLDRLFWTSGSFDSSGIGRFTAFTRRFADRFLIFD
jgi:hypothetical protein